VVETVGLENRCTGNRTGGSNPSPSAIQSGLQRNFLDPCAETLQSCLFFAIIPRQTGLERNGLLGIGCRHCLPFRRRSDAQSGFETGDLR
jgi:hypothetical protein